MFKRGAATQGGSIDTGSRRARHHLRVVELKVRQHLGGGRVEMAATFGGSSVVMRQGKGGIKKWRSAPNDVAG